MFLVPLLVASVAPGISACEDLGDAFIDLRNYFQGYEMPMYYESYKQEASVYNIDLGDDRQIRNFACALVEEESIDAISTLLELEDVKLPAQVEAFLDPASIRKEIKRVKNTIREYEQAYEFAMFAELPYFPLELSEEEALTLVKAAGEESLSRLFGNYVPGSDKALRQLAWALSHAHTSDEFNEFTNNKFEHVLDHFEERLVDLSNSHAALRPEPKLLERLMTVLRKYNIPAKFVEE